MFTKDEIRREIYESQLKAALDRFSAEGIRYKEGLEQGLQIGIQKGRQEGRQEGEQIGIQKGRQEGEQIGGYKKSVEMAKMGFKKGLDIQTIMELTGLTKEELEIIQSNNR